MGNAVWFSSGQSGRGLMLLAAMLSVPLAAAQTVENAGDEPAPQPPPQPYWLRVTGSEVNVRARPDVNSMAVTRVARDSVLQGVGEEHGWHKILPPPGVFALVSSAYVQREGEARGVVHVSSGSLRVRAGSTLYSVDPLLSDALARLPAGTPVQILGEEDGWLKIVPPEGVYFFLSADYIQRISEQEARDLRARAASQPAAPIGRPAVTGDVATAADTRVVTSRPAGATESTGSWADRLHEMEGLIDEESRKPPGERAWAPLINLLKPIASQREDAAAARLAEGWVERLQQRLTEETAAAAGRVAQGDSAARARHEQELQNIRAAQKATRSAFDAQGLLRPSFALPTGAHGLRYLLLDPFTRKTRAYVELPAELGLDARNIVGKYVGVRGTRYRDDRVGAEIIRVEQATVLEAQPSPPRQTP